MPQYHSFLFQHLLLLKQVGSLVLRIKVITAVNIFICGYGYVSYLASHMVTLEKFLHLNKDFPFFLGRV
jgi:hypothetical protein